MKVSASKGKKDEGVDEEEKKKDDGPRVTVPGLKQGIQHLIAQTGLACKAVFEVDGSRQSSHSNAYVAGMCGSKRIVVYDTLIRDIMDSPGVDKEGIFAIIGHEIGHSIMHHTWILLFVALANMFVMFFTFFWQLW